jgi:uncharacterized protein (UPF0212 family)
MPEMRPPSATELLNAWERGIALSPAHRAMLLLIAACPDMPVPVLKQLTIGQRNARLLALRKWLFGGQVAGVAACPQCGERLELAFDTRDVQAGPLITDGDEGTPLRVAAEGFEVSFRVPNGEDALAIAGAADGEIARRELLKRCVLSAERAGQPQSADDLPMAVVSLIAEGMAQADPQAMVQLSLTCPACGQRWLAAFDIAAYLWAEVDDWAKRTLRDVHVLASAYSWREADILALSPTRRRLYLDLIGR